MHYQTVLDFWFKEINSQQWWVKDKNFDQLIGERFSAVHRQASMGELFEWRECAEGRLAEIIVLDQFSRNMFRDRPESFEQDTLALVLAQEAIFNDLDKVIPIEWRSFMYMPFMHSESLVIHDHAIKLFGQEGMEFNLDFERKHRVIIEKFGRYPHRNAILKRESTQAELEFLKQPDSSF
ncbi:MAG: DUF924 domain-containing protein [Gammaproteobacteria bacterium]|nr:MAG: DUF924 domain-containing protein [Gammaproteobacteria bacterium]